jgi:hypothetical protein
MGGLILHSARAETTGTGPSTGKIPVLIVDGFSNHDWQLTTQLIRGVLDASGLFEVAISTAPPTADAPGWDTWRPKFSDYRVVVQTCNDIHGGPSWPRDVQVAFEEFVRQGGGTYIFHGGNNAFPQWPAYNDIIGLGWRKKAEGIAITVGNDGSLQRIPIGEGRDTGHGARTDIVLTRVGDHPIHAGLPRRWLTPSLEVYYYARGPAKNVDVLSYGYDVQTKMNWPIEWTVTYGKGRVFNSTFGHVWKGDVQPSTMRCAGVQTIIVRALQWLAQQPVTWPVPADFPTEEKTSVRAEVAIGK